MSASAVAEKEKMTRPMTMQIVKTKAEAALAEDFAHVESRLPGSDAIRRLRRDAIGRFSALGLPHRRVEEWKYTDLRNLLKDSAPLAAGGFNGEVHKFVEYALWDGLKGADQGGDWILFGDGKLVTANGKLAGSAHSLAHVLTAPPAWAVSEIHAISASAGNGVLALNTAFMTDGVVLDIPEGAQFAAPVHLIFHAGRAEGEDAANLRSLVTRNIIRIGKCAKVTLVESYAGHKPAPRHRNTLTQLIVGEGAEVTHIVASETVEGETHLAHTLVRIGAKALYRPFVMTSGLGIARHDMSVTFQGQHSTFDLAGLALGTASSHADLTLVVDHAVPHCTSRELYKSVLGGEAKSVFQGKVVVRPGAQKTDGKQMAQALMLSPFAEFDSKPELEIYADDVVCGHGSTSVEIDDDLLFYCRSRGIPLPEARALLIESFVGEAVEKIENEDLRAAVMTRARSWLAAGGL